jgi:hypothetical protein
MKGDELCRKTNPAKTSPFSLTILQSLYDSGIYCEFTFKVIIPSHALYPYIIEEFSF